MKLRSIPPANRRTNRLDRLSSMAAATHTGFTFVGDGIGSANARQEADQDTFAPRVIAPDPLVAETRRLYREAMARLAGQLEGLIETAEGLAEVEFWQAALDRLQK